MSYDEILSSITELKTNDFVYSSLSFYADRRGGELPGMWFVKALGALGLEETAIRQTLFRMERSGALETRTEGRSKVYRASATTRILTDLGTKRMLDDPDETPWDGKWTIVRFLLDREARKARDRLRDILTVEGFASLGSGLYIHPRRAATRVIDAAAEAGLERAIHVFRGDRIAGADDLDFAGELWDLASTASQYRRLVERFNPIRGEVAGLSPREAFGVRFVMVFEFLRITWGDPELPAGLLPADWPGDEARRLTSLLYRDLLPKAIEFGDEVMARIAGPVPRIRDGE